MEERGDLHPQMQKALALLAGPPLNELTPGESRAVQRDRFTRLNQPLGPVRRVSDLYPRGPDGPIPLRVIEPATPASDTPLPALVYFHGGGWVNGSHETVEPQCRYLANQAGCIVVSVEYRLAPEYKFPAAVDDALWATQWLHDHARDLRIDARRMAVGGDSAGGTLAAVVAQQWRTREDASPLRAQILLFPVTSMAFDTPSFRENAEGPHLTRALMEWFATHYLNDAGERRDVRASPLLAPIVARVAPATIITASHDPLRDDGRHYAEKLAADGVAVRYRNWEGYTHSFTNWAGVIDAAFDALEFCAAGLRAAFRVAPSLPPAADLGGERASL